jgi:hypothetical protein
MLYSIAGYMRMLLNCNLMSFLLMLSYYLISLESIFLKAFSPL